MTDTIETLQAQVEAQRNDANRFCLEVGKLKSRLTTLEAAAEKMAGALEQYEMALSEAAKDYERIYVVAKQHGLMTTAREADETAAYLYAMLQSRKSALQEYRKIKDGV